MRAVIPIVVRDVRHTPEDVLGRIDPVVWNQNVAAWVAALWMRANRDEVGSD